jgi:hypothetical protein
MSSLTPRPCGREPVNCKPARPERRHVCIRRGTRTRGAAATVARALLATLALLSALALGCSGAAAASPPPAVTLTHPLNGSLTNQSTPTFSGLTNDLLDLVTVKVYAGASAGASSPVQTLTVLPVPIKLLPPPAEATWAIAPASALKSGQYTALAEQTNVITHTGKSVAVTFTVDTNPPPVSIGAPVENAISSSPRPTFSGTAGQASGDRQSLQLAIYAGTTATGTPLDTLEVSASAGSWSTGSGGPELPNGIYTAQVTQSDEAGNVGVSTVTFAVDAAVASASPASSPASAATSAASAPPLVAPVASLQWFPTHPRTGERVVLASTSPASASPVTGFGWAVNNQTFTAAGPVLTTSFAKPGAHVVRMRVTDADGLSSVVAATIVVSAAKPSLMQPFPVVRIAGIVKSFGVDVSLLTVQAPVGAKVTVSCRGSGCPRRSQDEVATSKHSADRTGGVVLVDFPRFERALRAGATLQIRVAAAGEIGKYTRFAIRRGKLPVRVDACLNPAGNRPIACPT